MKRHSAREAQQPSFRVRLPTIPAQATHRAYMVVCDASIDADYVSRNVKRWFNTFVETRDSHSAQETRIDRRDARYQDASACRWAALTRPASRQRMIDPNYELNSEQGISLRNVQQRIEDLIESSNIAMERELRSRRRKRRVSSPLISWRD